MIYRIRSVDCLRHNAMYSTKQRLSVNLHAIVTASKVNADTMDCIEQCCPLTLFIIS